MTSNGGDVRRLNGSLTGYPSQMRTRLAWRIWTTGPKYANSSCHGGRRSPLIGSAFLRMARGECRACAVTRWRRRQNLSVEYLSKLERGAPSVHSPRRSFTGRSEIMRDQPPSRPKRRRPAPSSRSRGSARVRGEERRMICPNLCELRRDGRGVHTDWDLPDQTVRSWCREDHRDTNHDATVRLLLAPEGDPGGTTR